MHNSFTKGPWIAKPDPNSITTGDWCIGVEGSIDKVAVCSVCNARLIAASPDLLEALKACDEAMSYMSEYDIPITLPDMVKAAITKAIG